MKHLSWPEVPDSPRDCDRINEVERLVRNPIRYVEGGSTSNAHDLGRGEDFTECPEHVAAHKPRCSGDEDAL